MSLETLALIVTSVTLSAVAQVCFKLGLDSAAAHVAGATAVTRISSALLTPGVIAGLSCYGVGTLLWLSALARTELSQAYPFVGLGFALTTLAGWWLFSDALSPGRLAGISLIVIGIVLVARS
jgi:multidrug transporter EmrE-like cation transporter